MARAIHTQDTSSQSDPTCLCPGVPGVQEVPGVLEVRFSGAAPRVPGVQEVPSSKGFGSEEPRRGFLEFRRCRVLKVRFRKTGPRVLGVLQCPGTMENRERTRNHQNQNL